MGCCGVLKKRPPTQPMHGRGSPRRLCGGCISSCRCAGAIGSDAFVQETGLGKRFLKACRAIGFGIVRAVGEFRTAVGWDTRDGIRDSFRRRAQKTGGCAGAVLRKGFKAAETETMHRGRLAAELLSGGAAYGFCHTVFRRRFNCRLPKPHRSCSCIQRTG